MSFANSGSFPASLKPAQKRMTLRSNYLDFTSTGADSNNFAQQYLPELYEAEIERYGNRTIGGFLRMVGAEMPMTSDQVIWSEQNRLHIAYKKAQFTNAGAGGDVDGTVVLDLSATGADAPTGAIRVGQTILISDNATGLVVQKALVQGIADPVSGGGDAIANAGSANVFVYGSDFGKGTTGMEGSIEPSFTQYNNSPIIMKDNFKINGSDTAQIGWVEVATEDGQSGYLWYLKSESETRLRFEDQLEMAMVEAEFMNPADPYNSGKNFDFPASNPANTSQKIKGSEGLFAAIEKRGNVYSGFAGAAAPGSGALGDMALNFGFSGFRRGSYDFYKTDWKYLNDASLRGLSKEIDGVLVPAGTTTVYDQMLGSNIRRPFLHVRYRASETEDRRYKNWITGSVGGAFTSALDAMEVHFLTERCLVVQAANNFVLFKTV